MSDRIGMSGENAAMPTEHIVKSFDDELRHLRLLIARMGGLAETELSRAIDAIEERDSAIAADVIRTDKQVDDLEIELDAHVVRMLALRQPMAVDLREVLASLRIGTHLERIADYAKNVAKRTIALVQVAEVQPIYSVPRLGRHALAMLKDVLDAYNSRDVELALKVRERDAELDELYTSLFRELLTYMMEDPRNITASTHILFIAKNIERVGDHATNIAEQVHFIVKGEWLAADRLKGGQARGAYDAMPQAGRK